MAVVNNKSVLITNIDAINGFNDASQTGGTLKTVQENIPLSTDDATSTYEVLQIPTDVRIYDGFIVTDAAFVSAGTATIDVGFVGVDANITSAQEVKDAILDAFDIETPSVDTKTSFFVNGGTNAITIPNMHKYVWEMMGLATDPGGFLRIMITLNTTLTTGGNIHASCSYVVK